MRLAIVADWLTTVGGAERALAEFCVEWPDAPVFTTVARAEVSRKLGATSVKTSSLQPWYRLLGRHQLLLPWMPRAVEDMDLRGYDAILSSSHAVAKGIIPSRGAAHVCYCHTPMRYAWEMENQYLDDFRIPKILRKTAKKQLRLLRRWDLSTAKRVDVFLANSRETAGRIERTYGRDATVIPPPVQERFFAQPLLSTPEHSSFLAVGRLVPYKRFDLLIEWANVRKQPLTIVGEGYEEKRLKSLAGPTVDFRGRVSDDELPALYAKAKAVLFPTFEDAGIVPMEAQACGTPVIAYGKGGALDSVMDEETGLFFEQQTVDSLTKAIDNFSRQTFQSDAIRKHALKFSSGGFRDRIRKEVMIAYERFRK